MDQLSKKGLSLSDCVASYDLYAREVRHLAASTREIQRRILRRLCSFCFGDGLIAWDAICFTDIVRFLTAEFERYPNRGTQRASLTSMRTILRYLAENNMVPKGWDEALPRTATKRHAHLPRQLSREEIRALFKASQGNRWIGRYTHRIAISNNRLLDIEAGQVSFRYKDYRNQSQQKTMILSAEEFIRRFLLHALPHGFHRIRYYGFLGNRNRQEKLALCRQLLGMAPPMVQPQPAEVQDYRERCEELTGVSLRVCPVCRRGQMVLVGTLAARRRPAIKDTS
jgi:hypothetical protein